MNPRGILSTALICSATTLTGQVLMDGLEPGGARRLFASDAAVLDLPEPRTSLPCTVKPERPELGFDLSFHAGYVARVRLRDLAGDGDAITTIFRVTPDGIPEKAVYFQQKWRVPPIQNNAGGVTSLDGAFRVGEGDYQVDWLMRDRQERVCSAHWRISARVAAKEAQVPGGLVRGVVLPVDLAAEQRPMPGSPEQTLRIAILLNVGPQIAGAAMISERERQVLLSIVRGITAHPRIRSFAITCFSLEQNEVFFEQQNTRQIDFAGLEKATSSLNLGTVSASQLGQTGTQGRFLAKLAADLTGQNPADAVIFLGPRVPVDTIVNPSLFEQLDGIDCPVYYLTYSTASESDSWRDSLGSAVRLWKGPEFIISKPRDFLLAWSKIMSQLGSGNPWRRASGR